MSTPVALVPGVLALLPAYASIEDPVAELRAACLSAVAALGPRVRVRASGPSPARVAASLVAAAGAELVEDEAASGLLVVGNGSAKRSERAPGHLDPRAEDFDAGLRRTFAGIDQGLAAELWADTACLPGLPPLAEGAVIYDGAPFGVQYWVALWDAP